MSRDLCHVRTSSNEPLSSVLISSAAEPQPTTKRARGTNPNVEAANSIMNVLGDIPAEDDVGRPRVGLQKAGGRLGPPVVRRCQFRFMTCISGSVQFVLFLFRLVSTGLEPTGMNENGLHCCDFSPGP